MNRERGFTLIEVLISLSIVLIICSIVPLLLKNLYHLTFEPPTINPLELEVFIQQLNNEIRSGKETYVKNNVLTITTAQNDKITYEYYYNRLRRRVNGTGHVIVLQNIKSINFIETDNGVVLTITGLNDEAYSINAQNWLKGKNDE